MSPNRRRVDFELQLILLLLLQYFERWRTVEEDGHYCIDLVRSLRRYVDVFLFLLRSRSISFLASDSDFAAPFPLAGNIAGVSPPLLQFPYIDNQF